MNLNTLDSYLLPIMSVKPEKLRPKQMQIFSRFNQMQMMFYKRSTIMHHYADLRSPRLIINKEKKILIGDLRQKTNTEKYHQERIEEHVNNFYKKTTTLVRTSCERIIQLLSE